LSVGLALECSGARISVAAFAADGRCLAEAARLSEQGHVRHLSVLVAEALEAAGLRYAQLERLAVDVGPGSFTGLRVGLATARGLAKPRGLPVVGVSSFAALLEGYSAEQALVVPVLPAGGKQSYAGFFRSDSRGRPALLRGPAVGDVPALAAALRSALALCSRRTQVRVLGPGAVRERERWQAEFPGCLDESWRPDGPRAADVGRVSLRLAGGRLGRDAEVAPYTGATGLRPVYVRKPQAVERAQQASGGRALWDELEVVPLDLSRLEDVLRVERTVFGDPWPRRFFEDELRARESLARVVLHGAELAGYLLAWSLPEEIHLGNLAVAPEYQRRGVGSFMLRWLMDEARSRRARRIALEVRTSNFAAQELYRTHGFETVVLRRGYYQDSGEDALVMVCDLARVPESGGA
jgi:tRNA threonylcarbamoyl adenosine modification protein YeaZ/ribosomal-protein-alanine acetyltransferase